MFWLHLCDVLGVFVDTIKVKGMMKIFSSGWFIPLAPSDRQTDKGSFFLKKIYQLGE